LARETTFTLPANRHRPVLTLRQLGRHRLPYRRVARTAGAAEHSWGAQLSHWYHQRAGDDGMNGRAAPLGDRLDLPQGRLDARAGGRRHRPAIRASYVERVDDGPAER
jgi:hypothetical protein